VQAARAELAATVQASGTSLTAIFGVGPVIAATLIGEAGDIARFASRDAFAAYNGTAPVEVSSGRRKILRLSRRGNRRINHGAHMTAFTQIRYPGTEGRTYFELSAPPTSAIKIFSAPARAAAGIVIHWSGGA